VNMISGTSDMQTTRRLPELDGLRGVAILLVLLEHYVAESQQATGSIAHVLSRLFRMGWTGVDLFFVLSGFLIGGILLDVRELPNYVKTFYVRRAYRILPLYYVWITLYVVAGYIGSRWIVPRDNNAFAITVPIVVYYLFFQNFVFPPISSYGTFFVGPTWSLAVEEQFYLIAPWLIRFLPPRRLVKALILCVIAAPLLRAALFNVQHGHRVVYFLMPCRMDGLAMGMLCAVAWRTPAKQWMANHAALLKTVLAVLLLGFLAMLRWSPEPKNSFEALYKYSWIVFLYATLMMVALIVPGGVVARLARSRILGSWGRVSYCVYLIHLGILGACHMALLHSAPRIDDWRGALTTILAAALTWLIAQLSWRFFEKPLLDRGHVYKYESVQAPCSREERLDSVVTESVV
jgi:peptidoglycan/LPS O-acetylase OafA/YrhL